MILFTRSAVKAPAAVGKTTVQVLVSLSICTGNGGEAREETQIPFPFAEGSLHHA